MRALDSSHSSSHTVCSVCARAEKKPGSTRRRPVYRSSSCFFPFCLTINFDYLHRVTIEEKRRCTLFKNSALDCSRGHLRISALNTNWFFFGGGEGGKRKREPKLRTPIAKKCNKVNGKSNNLGPFSFSSSFLLPRIDLTAISPFYPNLIIATQASLAWGI